MTPATAGAAPQRAVRGATDAYVALLRGINVGRGNRVPMAELRALLEGLGYSHVSTLLNSGNAVFSASAKLGAAAEATIARAVADGLGVAVPVIVRSRRQVEAAIASNPAASVAEPSRLLVAFGRRPEALQALAALEPLLAPGESFHLTPDAAYLDCPGGISDSKAALALLGKLGRDVTTRNWATVRKIGDALAAVQLDEAGRPTPRRGKA